MRRALPVALLGALALLIPPGSAQDQLEPVLEIQGAFFGEEERIAVEPRFTTLTAPWAYSFPNAAPPAGNTTLSWSVLCDQGDVHLSGEPKTDIAFRPGAREYTGSQELRIAASFDTPGVTDLACTIRGTVAESPGVSAVQGEFVFNPQVEHQGQIRVNATVPSKMAGPQKMVSYPIELENLGNSRAMIVFEVRAEPGGKWQVLLPDSVLLDAGATKTAMVNLVTPYHNGYNKGSSHFQIAVISNAAEDPGSPTEEQVVDLTGSVQGWYVPGPSPILLFGVLAVSAFLQRRRN